MPVSEKKKVSEQPAGNLSITKTIEKAKEKAREYKSKIIENVMQEYNESSFKYLKLISKWKIHFGIMTLVAIVAAAVLSGEWFIKPKYRSFAIVYPSNITPYSEESTSEQMLQLFQSGDIRSALVRKFDLYKHYRIDSTDKLALAQMTAVYESNVEVNRTQFESIDINVLDEDPNMACAMVNEIINSMNLKARELQRDKTKEVEKVLRDQLASQKKDIDSIDNSLHELRVKYQLFDYDMQVKEVTKGYLKALNGGGKNLKEIDAMMRNLEEKGGEYYKLNKTMDVLLKSYSKTKVEYDNTQKDLTKELTYANVVTKPVPSYKKAYPVRWLIVLASVASANLFLFLLLIIIDSRKK
ncbi:MAG: hypothetical protein ACJ77K_01445 [Bacteroidia bacterium]